MALFSKNYQNMLNQALLKITTDTSITSTSPGSIARAFSEAILAQINDFYSILDFNLSQFNLSTATGRSLDLIGSLFNVQRKAVANLVAINASTGAFYFYLKSPYTSPITIPSGTLISTNDTSFIGQQLIYATIGDTTILTGRTKVFAGLIPQFATSTFTAGANTLTVIGPTFTPPLGVTVYCTNPKAIQAQVGQESDDSYRFRIQQAVRTAAGGTLNAVRMAGLNIAGVRDITILDTPYGLGSYAAVVVPEDNRTSTATLAAATAAMDSVRPVGVRMFTTLPNLLPVAVACSIILVSGTTADTSTVANGVQTAIIQFLNQPLVGTSLIYNELIQAILNTNDAISDVVVTNLAVNGTQILFKNYTPPADSQLIPGPVTVSLAS